LPSSQAEAAASDAHLLLGSQTQVLPSLSLPEQRRMLQIQWKISSGQKEQLSALLRM
jgi:hypothetical protein